MRLIGLAVVLALNLCPAPLAAEGQRATRLPHVGVLDPSTEGVDITLKAHALRDGMRELGWVDGQSIVLKLRFANRSTERLASLAKELVTENVDVIAPVGTDAALAAQRTATTIPIVMVGVAGGGGGRALPAPTGVPVRLRIGCISCRVLPRFAGATARRVWNLWITRALRNQQVAGSSPAAGSSCLASLVEAR